MSKVQTVLGWVEPLALGRTLTHEHLSIDFSPFFCECSPELTPFLAGDVRFENYGFVSRHPYSSKDNLVVGDSTDSAVLYDVQVYKQLGGGAIVENTSHGLVRRADVLYKVSKETGVHIVAGTGYYVSKTQPPSVKSMTIEQLRSVIVSDLTEGTAEDKRVKCGFIGEVGSNFPLDDFEKKSAEVTGLVQSELKCPVSFHPGRSKEAPFEIMRRYTEAGGDARKAVMSHLDRTLPTITDFLEFAAEFNCYCQLDLFGTELLHYQFNPQHQMPSDAQRINIVEELIKDGRIERILLSHDIHTKHRLIQFGGHGYTHLYTNVIPKMLFKGISVEQVDIITKSNPQTWLSWQRT